MKKIVYLMFFIPCFSWAGGSQVGTLGPAAFSINSDGYINWPIEGERNIKGKFRISTPVDLVKSLGIDSYGKVHFQYKGFDGSQIEIHAIDLNEFSPNYLEALKKSQLSKNWEPVGLDIQ